MSQFYGFTDIIVCKSFFGHMKDEVDFSTCKTLQEVMKKIDKYMDYYNNHRYQRGLKKMTPNQYRSHLLKITA